MATINPVGTFVSKGVYKTTWETLTASTDTIGAMDGARFSDKTVYVSGTFGSATVSLKGCNIATGAASDFVALTDLQGNAITFTANGLEVIAENPLKIMPTVCAATGGTDVDVIIISHGDV